MRENCEINKMICTFLLTQDVVFGIIIRHFKLGRTFLSTYVEWSMWSNSDIMLPSTDVNQYGSCIRII
jgi:hypothetical protein